jgi:hypothetical protein
MTTPYSQIAEIEALLRSMRESDRALVRSLYDIRVEAGYAVAPERMAERVRKAIGSAEGLRSQRIVKVLNRVTLEGTLFNPLRALRPQPPNPFAAPAAVEDPFADPEGLTSADPFGRIRGEHCVTAANMAKADAHHGLVIFDEPDPFRFDERRIVDYLSTAWRWMQAAHDYDPSAVYPLAIWNVGGRAGASQPHGHMQIFLASGRHYAKIDAQRRAALRYALGGTAGYFRDLLAAHVALGLAVEHRGATILAHLTPAKERELVVIAPHVDRTLFQAAHAALAAYRDYLGVTNFNMAVYGPPLAPTDEDWSGFPAVARLVDRGAAGAGTADYGGMEMYGQVVVSSDPFDVARVLTEAVNG